MDNLEDKTIIIVEHQGFIATTCVKEAMIFSHTVNFNRINTIFHDGTTNEMVVHLIDGKMITIFDVEEKDYLSISYNYRTWSARL